MSFRIEAEHELTPNEIGAIEDHIYEHNSNATGRDDGRHIGFVIRNEVGQMIGVAAGFTWSGTCELKQMWIDESYSTHRGQPVDRIAARICEWPH